MRYIQNTPDEISQMLETIGKKSIQELFEPIPQQIRLKQKLNLPQPLSEYEVYKHMQAIAKKNLTTEDFVSFLGAGCYEHYIPAVVNAISSRGEFYTSYTPYQSEASQGNLHVIFEYQTMICELTGYQITNASHYDGATALSEAVFMAIRKTQKTTVAVSKTLHPEYQHVLKTYLDGRNWQIIHLPYKNGVTDIHALDKMPKDTLACLVVQNPNFLGYIEDLMAISDIAHNNNIVSIAVVEPVSLAILKPPGECQIDICVGDGQSLGLELSLGGPLLGFIATNAQFLRQMPGRIVGQTNDTRGRKGFVLALQTREQHIRREHATSNICTNQALMALRAAVFLEAMGREGLKKLAHTCMAKTHYLASKIKEKNLARFPFNAPFFQEFVVQFNKPVSQINNALLKHKIFGGVNIEKFYPELKNSMLICINEKITKQQMDNFVDCLEDVL
jgi:glycine dehydrogenase subunit 1